MAVTFVDSVGHYAVADVLKKASQTRYLDVAPLIDATGGPAGAPCFKIDTDTNGGGAGVYYAAAAASGVYASGRFKIPGLTPCAFGTPIIEVRNRAYIAVGIFVTPTGAVAARSASSGTYAPLYVYGYSGSNVTAMYNVLHGTSDAGLVSVGAWAHIEAYVTLSASAGVVQVWVNGALALDLSGLDTVYDTDTTVALVGMGILVQTEGTFGYISDICLATTRQEEVRADSHFPDANGSDRTMTRSSGDDDYVLLDEAEANTTDYLSSDAVDERVSVNVEALRNTGGTIKAVQINAYLTKQNAGTAGITPYVLRGGTRYYGDEWFPAWGSWKFFTYVWDNDPVTAAAWTESNFNSSEFGLERTT